jgi:hypothetical protein
MNNLLSSNNQCSSAYLFMVNHNMHIYSCICTGFFWTITVCTYFYKPRSKYLFCSLILTVRSDGCFATLFYGSLSTTKVMGNRKKKKEECERIITNDEFWEIWKKKFVWPFWWYWPAICRKGLDKASFQFWRSWSVKKKLACKFVDSASSYAIINSAPFAASYFEPHVNTEPVGSAVTALNCTGEVLRLNLHRDPECYRGLPPVSPGNYQVSPAITLQHLPSCFVVINIVLFDAISSEKRRKS